MRASIKMDFDTARTPVIAIESPWLLKFPQVYVIRVSVGAKVCIGLRPQCSNVGLHRAHSTV